jgi:nitroreductase
MELRDVMRTTPATRSFTDDDIPDDDLHAILDAARFAPSGSSRQSWKVVVVRDAATKARIAELYELGMREYGAYLRAGLVPFAASDAMRDEPPVDLAAARDVPGPQAPPHIAAAPVLLVLLLDTENTSAVDAGLGRIPLTAGGSLFPFAQNVLLAARDLGYGGHLTSVLARQEPGLRELLHIPPRYVLGTMIPLGRPTKVITKLSRAPVESFATTGTFDGPPFEV